MYAKNELKSDVLAHEDAISFDTVLRSTPASPLQQLEAESREHTAYSAVLYLLVVLQYPQAGAGTAVYLNAEKLFWTTFCTHFCAPGDSCREVKRVNKEP